MPSIIEQFEKELNYSENEEELMSCLVCPITTELFNQPVLAADGQIYEETAFTDWWKLKGTSPMTGADIIGKTTKVYNIKSIIDKMIENNPSLKSMKYEPDIIYSNNKKVIQDAIIAKNFNVLKKYKDFDLLDLSKTSINKYNLLQFTIANCNNESILKHIFSNSFNINFKTSSNWNIINFIIKENNLTALKIVLNYKIDTDHKIVSLWDIYHYTVRYCDMIMIEYVFKEIGFPKKLETASSHADYISLISSNTLIGNTDKKIVRSKFYDLIAKNAVSDYTSKCFNKTLKDKEKSDAFIEKMKKQILKK
jgi:hypothetical protein